jgi:hypothetical protein
MLPRLPLGVGGDAPPVELQVAATRRRFRGTPYGRILESPDGGQSWRSVANFGEHCAILRMFEHQGQIYAEVGIQGYSFFLRSPDASIWYTTDPVPAAG